MTEVKRIDIKEFREVGYLQEVNRLFLHPLGLALEVEIADDGSEHLGGVWDYREDPEGVCYGDPPDPNKANRVHTLMTDRIRSRVATLGYWVQAAEGPEEPESSVEQNDDEGESGASDEVPE